MGLTPPPKDCPLFPMTPDPTTPYPCPTYKLVPSGPVLGWASEIGVVLSVFLFTFAMLATVPAVRKDLADPSQMHGVLSWSFGIIVLISCSVMLAGYLAYGVESPDNVIVSMTVDFP